MLRRFSPFPFPGVAHLFGGPFLLRAALGCEAVSQADRVRVTRARQCG